MKINKIKEYYSQVCVQDSLNLLLGKFEAFGLKV